jgi:hypothetical protein
MTELLRKLEVERKLWAEARLKGLAAGTPERDRIVELEKLIDSGRANSGTEISDLSSGYTDHTHQHAGHSPELLGRLAYAADKRDYSCQRRLQGESRPRSFRSREALYLSPALAPGLFQGSLPSGQGFSVLSTRDDKRISNLPKAC